MRITLILSFGLIASLGCSSNEEAPAASTTPEPTTPAAESKEAPPEQPPRILDIQGNLIPSDEYLIGIRLPRGMVLFRADELTHVYRIRAPIDKVLAYFGPMMITGKVERRGEGAIYRQASVRGAEVNPTKVDVSILDVGRQQVRVEITELPPPARYTPSVDTTRSAARDTWRRLD